jgi:hypothetical protein
MMMAMIRATALSIKLDNIGVYGGKTFSYLLVLLLFVFVLYTGLICDDALLKNADRTSICGRFWCGVIVFLTNRWRNLRECFGGDSNDGVDEIMPIMAVAVITTRRRG